MYITLTKEKNSTSSHTIECDKYNGYYRLDEKEVFFENPSFYLFLKSNYSESYIDGILNLKEQLTPEMVCNSFRKDGFWIIIDKNSYDITINRDLSGLCTGYFSINDKFIHVGTNVHELGSNLSKELDEEAVHQLLYFDYLWDGQTIYDNVNQFKIGATLHLSCDFDIVRNEAYQPNIVQQENELSEEDNIKKLREEIVKSHERYLNNKNIVFLSGGIDSVAMLIALNDLTKKEQIVNHSFKVKGTTQDETFYAKSIASHLDNDLLIIERDLTKAVNNEQDFKKGILKMNNPYPGMWIFGNQVDNETYTTYFAGQDTRLHTPSLNKLDEIAFDIFMLSKKGFGPIFKILDVLVFPFKGIFNYILKSKKISHKLFLGLRRALFLFNTSSYIKLVYFKVDSSILESYGLPLVKFQNIVKDYDLNLSGITDKRMLYNAIVTKKWKEQYVNDMRYMIDMVNNQGGKLGMPFYDMDLAMFSATIPFNLSIKKMQGKGQFDNTSKTINKYVLRESLADKIDKNTYLRSKAVSRTGHLFFNEQISVILKGIINQDLSSNNSFIKKYRLNKFLQRFLDGNNGKPWGIADDKYLLKVYYTVCLIVYKENIEVHR